jgi:hypothetical protein
MEYNLMINKSKSFNLINHERKCCNKLLENKIHCKKKNNKKKNKE